MILENDEGHEFVGVITVTSYLRSMKSTTAQLLEEG